MMMAINDRYGMVWRRATKKMEKRRKEGVGVGVGVVGLVRDGWALHYEDLGGTERLATPTPPDSQTTLRLFQAWTAKREPVSRRDWHAGRVSWCHTSYEVGVSISHIPSTLPTRPSSLPGLCAWLMRILAMT